MAFLCWLPLGVAVADWLALKSGLLTHPPAILTALVGLAALALLVRGVSRVATLLRTRSPLAGAEALLLVGVLLALGAGSANWLLGLQGFVVLYEGERVPLAGGSHLQELVGGPLARLSEMDLVLGLEEVELLPVAPGGPGERPFVPRSHLWISRRGKQNERLSVETRRLAAVGPLRFHQGAFGFAPRIVIEKAGATVFDQVVPFTTERHGELAGARGLSFAGAFTLERESLRVDGRVDLASLDAGLRGHATVDLNVRRQGEGGEVLGRGRLLPGHFADVGGNYRIGFVGLKKWSEILISRRGYGSLMLAGAGLALLGLLALPIVAWRGGR